MIRKCICCEKEFEPNNNARKYCYDCSPELNVSGNTSERLKFTNNAWKKEFIRLRGGSCQLCGYDKTIQALEFHHINPDEKTMVLNHECSGNYLRKVEEMKKCALICANCHREVHYGLVDAALIRLDNSLIDSKIQYLKNYEKENFEDNDKKTICPICGGKKSSSSKMCVICQHKLQQKSDRPESLELARMIVEKGFVQVGKDFGVSDNAIKKWCKSYGIPHLKQDLKKWYENNKAS